MKTNRTTPPLRTASMGSHKEHNDQPGDGMHPIFKIEMGQGWMFQPRKLLGNQGFYLV